MKKLLSILLGVGLAFVIFGMYTLGNDGRCERSFDRMNSILKCVDQAPCLYFATDLYAGRQAARHYQARCELYELRRPKKD